MKKEFNQKKYIADWQKNNMKIISVRYKNEFVEEFKKSCQILGLSQSSIFKEAMIQIIEKAKNKL